MWNKDSYWLVYKIIVIISNDDNQKASCLLVSLSMAEEATVLSYK